MMNKTMKHLKRFFLDDFDTIMKNPKSPDSLDILGSPDSIFKSKKTGPIELVPSNFSFYYNQQD